MILDNKNYKNGFTIIELVITIFVLSIAVIGAYNAFTIMNILTSNSSDRFTAAYLAQEGIEIVRNIRDTNWIEEDDWTAGLSDGDWEADYKTFGDEMTPLEPYGSGSYLLVDENGFYNYLSGDETKFKRKIALTSLPIPGTEEDVFDILKVSVTVSWDEKANILHREKQEQLITVEEYLYNWLYETEE